MFRDSVAATRALLLSKTPAALTPYSLTTALKTATPDDAGFDSGKLDTATSFTTPHSHTQGILVLRGGYVIAEHYIAPFTADTRHESYSMAKSFTSGLVGISIDSKALRRRPHAPLHLLSRFVEVRRSERRSRTYHD